MVVMLINSHTNNYITVILDGVGLNNVQNHLSSYQVEVGSNIAPDHRSIL